MSITQLQVLRTDFATTQVHEAPTPELADGQVLVEIARFALTANNVTYAFSGDMIGYWKFFPADGPWGITPVWGLADVVASKHPEIAVGERIWGFLPMASHLVLEPSKVSRGSFVDGATHRRDLPAVYNNYQRTSGDPPELKALEDQRCVLFPLFSTSYVLYDYLVDNDFFGAEQVLIGSASSKTGFGLAHLLFHHEGKRPRVVGLTSPGNVAFVKDLGFYDEVVTYDAIPAMDPTRTSAFVDMAGQGPVITAVHMTFGPQLKLSCAVGVTHWTSERFRGEGAVTPHTFFFAPAQFQKRDADWGPGEIMRRAQRASVKIAMDTQSALKIEHVTGAKAVADVWTRLVAGQMSPDVGVMASLKG